MSDQPDVRASFQRFPGWSQRLWTWYTGKPLPGQRPRLRPSPWLYLAANLTGLFGSAAASVWLLRDRPPGWPLLLLISWGLTVSCSRIASTVIAHQCMHRRFTGNTRFDRAVAQVLSTIVCTEAADDYFNDHIRLHHRKATFATMADPTITHLLHLGFLPGLSRRELWRRLLWTVVSPRFHLHFALQRLRQNLVTPPLYRRAMSLAWLTAVAALVHLNQAWGLFAAAILVPLVPFYQVVALLEFLSEHAWFKSKGEAGEGKAFHVSHSWGRFHGDPLPPPGLSTGPRILQWGRWLLRAALYHLPARVLVVPGDLVAHDYHHRMPSTFDWTTATFARQRDIDAGHPGWPPYTDVWGLGNAIDRVFFILSEQSSTGHAIPRPDDFVTGVGVLGLELE
jgi:hypothetical protein